MDTPTTDCARARESVSADLDGELHELEIRRLHAHLRHCADCATWADRARVTTTELRESAREAPAAPVFEPAARSARTWRVRPMVAPAAVLVAIAAVVFGGMQHGLFSGHLTTSQSLGRRDPYLIQNSVGAPLYLYKLPVPHHVLQAV